MLLPGVDISTPSGFANVNSIIWTDLSIIISYTLLLVRMLNVVFVSPHTHLSQCTPDLSVQCFRP